MGQGRVMTSDHVGIVELAEICARERLLSLELFELTGEWVGSTPPGKLQRHFATATHRHAWHAELWAERCPAIPSPQLDAPVAPRRAEPSGVDAGERHVMYRARLDGMLTSLRSIADRIDAELDPSTARTVSLVTADLIDLRDR